MKFFWKIYFSFTTLFLVSFGLFGIWMIQINFEKSYKKAALSAALCVLSQIFCEVLDIIRKSVLESFIS